MGRNVLIATLHSIGKGLKVLSLDLSSFADTENSIHDGIADAPVVISLRVAIYSGDFCNTIE